ncbi:MAG TPA: zinc ribbon domain-containing protein [Pyrinomonadaceae bacterium]|nr:zinc ribbon domain-containing protein [Pyrinomonadaceae bacterium]
MYCPKCSQEQLSEEVRFCSRCGFSIGVVRELIASGNAVTVPGPDVQVRSCGQKAVRRGAWIMLGCLAFTLFVGLMTAMDDDFAVLILLPFLGFVIGLLTVFYGAFWADKRALKRAASKSQVVPMMPGQPGSPGRTPELPAARITPIESFTGQRGQTAEMTQSPPSVTENTTRLLDEESDPRRR